MEQAKTAAASICGQTLPYASYPWFWSDQYDLKLQIAGLSQGFDQVVIHGDHENSRSFVAWYLRKGKLLAADCVNRPKEFLVAKQLLSRGIKVDPAKLVDESIDPKTFLQ
jgi:3-phenylpropionate/trans-cinnamate dioxygenase ferredoxin reductase subunit